MIRLIIIILLFSIALQLNAQIDYGSSYYILDKQQETLRKKLKVKTIYTYTFADSLQIEGTEDNYYENQYNKDGLLEVSKFYLREKTTNKLLLTAADSFSYTQKGILKEKRKFTSIGNEKLIETERMSASFNEIGLIDTIHIFNIYSTPLIYNKYELQKVGFKLYKYNSLNKIDSIYYFNSGDLEKEKLYTYRYDGNNNIIINNVEIGSGIYISMMTYTINNLLESHLEAYFTGSDVGKTKYYYDNESRLIESKYTTDFSFQYDYLFYNGRNKVPTYRRVEHSTSIKNGTSTKYYKKYKYEYFE